MNLFAYEAMERTTMILDLLDSSLAEHRYVVDNHLQKKVEIIEALLADIYQQAGLDWYNSRED